MRITVRAGREGAGTAIRVHNTGDPLPEAQLERIFDRFYRGPGAETGTSWYTADFRDGVDAVK